MLLGLVVVGLVWVLSEAGTTAYTSTTEEQLAQVLAQIEGVGQVSVFVYKGEREQGLFTTEEQGEFGVLLVAEGAKVPAVRRQLEDTVKRVLQLPAHRIAILPMKEEEMH